MEDGKTGRMSRTKKRLQNVTNITILITKYEKMEEWKTGRRENGKIVTDEKKITRRDKYYDFGL